MVVNMLIDFEVTLTDKDFTRLAKLAEVLRMSVGDAAILCMKERVEEYLAKFEYYEREAELNDESQKETSNSTECSQKEDDPESSYPDWPL
jgi:hypothetical protein